MLGPLLNNLSATSSYVRGVDRTEYQDGQAHNFSVGLDYVVADDSARTLDRSRTTRFRWNPTQLRLTSGVVNATDRRLSFIKPAGALDEQPTVSSALSRLWRNGSVFELRPTEALTARWELQSSRDLRDYGDTTTHGAGRVAAASVDVRREHRIRARAIDGDERELRADRLVVAASARRARNAVQHAPRSERALTRHAARRDRRRQRACGSRFHADRALVHAAASHGCRADGERRRVDRRRARAFVEHTEDSTVARRIGALFAPVDVSYSRSLLSALDAAPVGAPLLLQLGLGGPASFRHVRGVDATTAGQTGTFSASGALVLPLGTSFVNRYRRTTTLNWISRPDAPQAQIDGQQVQFPDVALRWAYRPAVATGVVSNFDASVGYVRSDVTVSLPSLLGDAPPEVRHTHVETFPISATMAWAGSRGFSTGARFSLTRRIDTSARQHRSFARQRVGRRCGPVVPHSGLLGLGLRNDVRTRMGFQQTHNTTFVIDPSGAVQSRLQDNGRQRVQSHGRLERAVKRSTSRSRGRT